MQADALGAGSVQADALLVELDRRAQRFIAKRGEEGLVQALEAWVHSTPDLMAMVTTSPFKDPMEFEARLARLEREQSSGRGLRQLDHALYCMGVLRSRLYPGPEEQAQRSDAPAMLEVVWPTTSEDGRLRGELAVLIGEPLARAAWELYALRIFAFSFVASVQFRDDLEAGNRLRERVAQLFGERTRGELAPPNLEQFLDHRRREYFKIVEKGSPKSEFMPTPVIAGAFAWYCRRTSDLQVRLIGAREFTVAYRRLDAMIEAYRGSSLD